METRKFDKDDELILRLAKERTGEWVRLDEFEALTTPRPCIERLADMLKCGFLKDDRQPEVSGSGKWFQITHAGEQTLAAIERGKIKAMPDPAAEQEAEKARLDKLREDARLEAEREERRKAKEAGKVKQKQPAQPARS